MGYGCFGQYNTLLWEESFMYLFNAFIPLDVPLSIGRNTESTFLNSFIRANDMTKLVLQEIHNIFILLIKAGDSKADPFMACKSRQSYDCLKCLEKVAVSGINVIW